MTSRDAAPPAEATRRGTGFGVVVAAAGVLLAAWIVAGRALFGAGGDLVLVFAVTLGPLVAVLHVFTGRFVIIAARHGFALRPAAIVTWAVSLVAGLLFGLTVTDATPSGLRSVLADGSDPVGLELSIAICNPLGVVMIGTSVAALIVARLGARGPVERVEED